MREREREREIDVESETNISGWARFDLTRQIKTNLYIYIYIYIVREREIKTNSEREERVTDISGLTCLDRICDCSL